MPNFQPITQGAQLSPSGQNPNAVEQLARVIASFQQHSKELAQKRQSKGPTSFFSGGQGSQAGAQPFITGGG